MRGEGERRERRGGILLTKKERRKKSVLGGSGRRIAVLRRSSVPVMKEVSSSVGLSGWRVVRCVMRRSSSRYGLRDN